MVGLIALATMRAGAATEAYGALIWFAGLLVLIGLAIAIVATIRRRFRREGSEDGGGFTLDQLRVLRNRGELTAEEYESLKRGAAGMPSPAREAQCERRAR